MLSRGVVNLSSMMSKMNSRPRSAARSRFASEPQQMGFGTRKSLCSNQNSMLMRVPPIRLEKFRGTTGSGSHLPLLTHQ